MAKGKGPVGGARAAQPTGGGEIMGTAARRVEAQVAQRREIEAEIAPPGFLDQIKRGFVGDY